MLTPRTLPVIIFTMSAQAEIIAALIGEQQRAGESDYQFAERLGMHRTMWWHLKNGRSNLSLPLVRGILKAYPKLTPKATELLFLPEDVKK